MTRRTASRLAWSIAGIEVLAILSGVLLHALTPNDRLPPLARASVLDLVDNLTAIMAVLIGALIASRHPRNPLGWLFLLVGFGIGFADLGTIYAARGLVVAPGSLPAPRFAGWLANWVWGLGVGSLPFLTLLLPTGRPHSRRWRPLVWAAVAAASVPVGTSMIVASQIWTTPLLAEADWPESLQALTPVLVASLLAILAISLLGAISMVLRYRSAGPEERQQLKWIIAGASVLIVALAADSFIEGPIVAAAVLLASVGLYASLGIAILKYRLYDIDRIINRTLVYGVLTVVLAAVYVGAVVGLGALVGESTLLVAGSTLLVAALFRPARRRIQGLIDRRFYRSKYDAARTLDAFAARLREEVDLDSLAGDLVVVVRDTLQPAHASLWLAERRNSVPASSVTITGRRVGKKEA